MHQDRHDSESVIPECHAPPNILRIPMFLREAQVLHGQAYGSPRKPARFSSATTAGPPVKISRFRRLPSRSPTSRLLPRNGRRSKPLTSSPISNILPNSSLATTPNWRSSELRCWSKKLTKPSRRRITRAKGASKSSMPGSCTGARRLVLTPARVWANGSRTLRLAQRWW